jgi:hypothetical protein
MNRRVMAYVHNTVKPSVNPFNARGCPRNGWVTTAHHLIPVEDILQFNLVINAVKGSDIFYNYSCDHKRIIYPAFDFFHYV